MSTNHFLYHLISVLESSDADESCERQTFVFLPSPYNMNDFGSSSVTLSSLPHFSAADKYFLVVADTDDESRSNIPIISRVRKFLLFPM